MKTCLEYIGLNIYKFLISQNISADLKGPKEKYKLHNGRCTGLLNRAATQHMIQILLMFYIFYVEDSQG